MIAREVELVICTKSDERPMNVTQIICKHAVLLLSALALPLGTDAQVEPLKVFILAGENAIGWNGMKLSAGPMSVSIRDFAMVGSRES